MAKSPKAATSARKTRSKTAAAPAEQKTSNSPKKATKKAAPKAQKPASSKEYGYVSKAQASKALSELKKFIERDSESKLDGKSELFDVDALDEDRDVFVEFQTKKYYSEKPEFKPKLIELTKPFYRENEELKTCLFLRDHFITSEEKLEEVENADIPTLSKILTLTQLKTIYQTFEKRRELFDEYDLFLVDDALLSSMPQVLGKTFYKNRVSHKFPVNVRVASTKSPKELSLVTLNNQVNKVLSSTAFLPPVGTSISVKIGNISFLESELLGNLHNVLEKFDEDLLVSAAVKTTNSPLLPLYYTDKIYSDADVLENAPKEVEQIETEDAFETALLELGDETSVAKALGAELRKKKKGKKSNGVSKP